MEKLALTFLSSLAPTAHLPPTIYIAVETLLSELYYYNKKPPKYASTGKSTTGYRTGATDRGLAT